jgi:serine/threonine-protein kinase RIO1
MDTLTEAMPSVEESEEARKTGKLIGSGAFRDVYRLPGSPWVYKFERPVRIQQGNGCNKREYSNFLLRKDSLPEGVDFPEMYYLSNNVLAAEFIDGVNGREAHPHYKTCLCESFGISKCWRDAIQSLQGVMRDLHMFNIMISPSARRVYIIDIGEYGNDNDRSS